jgi:hypothetical protein
MPRNIRTSKRKVLGRTSGVNLYADQAVQVQAIMESIGEKRESPVLRILIDEALAARRRKAVHHGESELAAASIDLAETLQTIQMLLLKLIRQSETTLRAQDITLMLAQEHLAETMFGRKIVWNRLEVASLLEVGILPHEISERLAVELAEAKNSAYGIAEEISQRSEEQPNDNRPLATEDEFPVEGDFHSQG